MGLAIGIAAVAAVSASLALIKRPWSLWSLLILLMVAWGLFVTAPARMPNPRAAGEMTVRAVPFAAGALLWMAYFWRRRWWYGVLQAEAPPSASTTRRGKWQLVVLAIALSLVLAVFGVAVNGGLAPYLVLLGATFIAITLVATWRAALRTRGNAALATGALVLALACLFPPWIVRMENTATGLVLEERRVYGLLFAPPEGDTLLHRVKVDGVRLGLTLGLVAFVTLGAWVATRRSMPGT